MKAICISLLGLAFSTAYALPSVTELQTTATVQHAVATSEGLRKRKAPEEVVFEFEKTHALLEESRNTQLPTTLTLPLGNDEIVEVSVQGKTQHVGQFVWQNGQFARKENPYLGFEGTTKEGEPVRGFINDAAFSAIVHSATAGRILVQSKSLQINDQAYQPLQNIGLEEPDITPSTNALLSPLPPAQFQSPVDANGYVQLRHIGLAFTLSWNLFHSLDPTVTPQDLRDNPALVSVPVENWMLARAQEIEDILKSQLGVTIQSIGDGQGEKKGFGYLVQVPDGYSSAQPPNSIFDDPSVPFTTLGWLNANHAFQTWAVQLSGESAWWDAGIALGGVGDILGGQGAKGGVCNSSQKGRVYAHLLEGAMIPLHELGHLLGASHTFSSQNGSCEGNLAVGTSVEPGSGSTIMSYGGSCLSDNVQPYRDWYYHTKSIEEINTTLSNLEATDTCISHEPTQNRRPELTMSAYPDRNIIPKGVRFELKATFTDPDLDAQISQNPGSVSSTIKLEGAGKVNWEQIDSLADTLTLGPRYRSLLPITANYPAIALPANYRTGYVRSFPDAYTPLGTPWDPLITDWDTANYPIGIMNFRATGWDYNANMGAGFPGFVSADVPVFLSPSSKPSFTFPAANQLVKSGQPYTVTWLPNFASQQPQFGYIQLKAKIPTGSGWATLGTVFHTPGNLNSFSNVQFPKQTDKCSKGLGVSYTSTLRLKYETLGDVAWYVDSPEFQVQDEVIKCSGFE